MRTMATVAVGFLVIFGDLAIEAADTIGPVVAAALPLYLAGHIAWAVITGAPGW